MNSIKEGIQTNFMRLLVLLAFILVCAGLYYAGELAYGQIFRKSIKREIFQDKLFAEIKRMNTVIEAVQKTPQDLAYILEFHNTSEAEMKILLKSMLFNNEELFGGAIAFEPNSYNKDSFYYSRYVYRQRDSVIFTNLDDPEYDYFYKDWYLIPKTMLKPAWSEPYYDEGGGNSLMSTYSVPFYRYDGNQEVFNGIVTVDVSIEWLTNAVESIGRLLNAKALLMSENGTIISAPEKEWIYNQTIYTLASEMNIPVLRRIGRDLRDGNSGIEDIEEFQGEKEWVLFYSPIKASRWGMILLLPENELLKIKRNE